MRKQNCTFQRNKTEIIVHYKTMKFFWIKIFMKLIKNNRNIPDNGI